MSKNPQVTPSQNIPAPPTQKSLNLDEFISIIPAARNWRIYTEEGNNKEADKLAEKLNTNVRNFASILAVNNFYDVIILRPVKDPKNNIDINNDGKSDTAVIFDHPSLKETIVYWWSGDANPLGWMKQRYAALGTAFKFAFSKSEDEMLDVSARIDNAMHDARKDPEIDRLYSKMITPDFLDNTGSNPNIIKTNKFQTNKSKTVSERAH